MIKLICIIKNDAYPYPTIEKDAIVFAIEDTFYGNEDWFGAFTNEPKYLGARSKKYFISLDEWRNQQIDKILNN
jgi:hypothetical protein